MRRVLLQPGFGTLQMMPIAAVPIIRSPTRHGFRRELTGTSASSWQPRG
jgi:hypothetical protein